jgi:phosphoserine phosphatase
MKVIFVRHAESEDNVKRIVQGQKQTRLTKKGREQSKKLAKRLKNEEIDIIFSSDLNRAIETTKEIIKFHKAPVIYTEELRERNLGILEGKPFDEFNEILKKSKEGFYYNPEGGESVEDFQKRAAKFFKKILKKYKKKTILIVSHGGLTKGILAYLLKQPIEDIFKEKMHNASVNILEIDDKSKKVKVHVLNCTKHL